MPQWQQQDSQVSDSILGLARSAILDNLGSPHEEPGAESLPSILENKGASYVRLTIDGQLRGENGSPHCEHRLPQSIRQSAYRAAFSDSRFQPIKPDELDRLDVEVSLVTPLEPISANSVTELGDCIIPAIDGLHVVTEYGEFSLFPSYWASHSNTRMFITQLLRKAHIDPREWHDDYEWYKFQTLTFSKPHS